MAAQTRQEESRRAQWAAQFAVASELSKRGYHVALTMGINPAIDLIVLSPKGIPFLIDVKGQHQKDSWPVRLKQARGKLFYAFAFVPDVGQNRFFVLPEEVIKAEVQSHLQRAIARRQERGLRGEPLYTPRIAWDFIKKHEGAWKVLPD